MPTNVGRYKRLFRRTAKTITMAMRWRLWEDDFHASMFDASAECREDDTAKPCRCSGRGRPRPQLADLRLPYALRVQRDNERRGVKGKGRAHVLQQRVVSSKGPGRHHKSNPLEKAEILLEQFQSVFTTEDGSVPPHLDLLQHPSICDITIDTVGVCKLLKSIKPFKACGFDQIPNAVLKNCTGTLAPAL
ncbi:hypothetical protein LSAT2_024129 [Lamellibrachia satsuma]|nr:hypothetical protein LSAT2_024129 [Lamellibrachia satsuma]